MTFRTLSCLASCLLLAGTPGCQSAEGRAAKPYDTAQFEEKQTNLEHAMHLYKEILVKYPDTSWTEKARARLEAIKEKP